MLVTLASICVASAVEFVNGEVLVKFKSSHALAGKLSTERIGARSIERIHGIGVERIKLAPGMSVRQAVNYYQGLPGVEFAEPNQIVRIAAIPNDPSYGSQWGPKKIQCEPAWDLTLGSSSVVVAIVDTGIDLVHSDLSGKLVSAGRDFINNDNSADDDNGHGTHCAGIAAASTNNGLGIAGVGWNIRLLPVKVLAGNGSGTLSAVANGINWAADPAGGNADVISLSLGASGGSSTLESSVNYAWNQGAVVVAAAGNNNSSSPSYPAFYANCIAVGSTDQNDNRSSFSNFGASWVDVAAPGSSIYSTYDGNRYSTLSGTSMATPHVAGQAALVISYLGSGWTNTAVRQRIENNCDPVGSWVAKGRVNVLRSLTNGGGGGGGGGTFTAVPSAFFVSRGSVWSGGTSSLGASDDNRLDMRSTTSGSTRYVDWYGDAYATVTGTINRVDVTVENNCSPTGTVYVYLWDYTTSTWTLVGTQSNVGSSDVTATYSVTTNPSRFYNSANGEMSARIYRARSGSQSFNVRTDLVRFTVTTQ